MLTQYSDAKKKLNVRAEPDRGPWDWRWVLSMQSIQKREQCNISSSVVVVGNSQNPWIALNPSPLTLNQLSALELTDLGKTHLRPKLQQSLKRGLCRFKLSHLSSSRLHCVSSTANNLQLFTFSAICFVSNGYVWWSGSFAWLHMGSLPIGKVWKVSSLKNCSLKVLPKFTFSLYLSFLLIRLYFLTTLSNCVKGHNSQRLLFEGVL